MIRTREERRERGQRTMREKNGRSEDHAVHCSNSTNHNTTFFFVFFEDSFWAHSQNKNSKNNNIEMSWMNGRA